MKLTFEVSDAICKRIKTVAGQKGPTSVEAFIQLAIESELQRVECNRAIPGDCADLAGLARQVQRLEKGQRAIVALVDSSATLLAASLRGRGDRPR